MLRSVKIVHQQTLLTLRAHHAQLRQIAQVLNSEQPHLEENSLRLTTDCNDRIGLWQKGHTAQTPSACQVLLEWAGHIVVCRTRQAQHTTLRASHRPSAGGTSHPTLTIQCTSRSSDRKTAIQKKPGQRPSMFCDLRFCPAATPFAQRMADCRSCRAAIRSVLLSKSSSDFHRGPAGRCRIPRGG